MIILISIIIILVVKLISLRARFKLEMNWNQEELEQWAIAARRGPALRRRDMKRDSIV